LEEVVERRERVMDRDESWRTIDEHRVAIADLLDTLTPQEWATPSLCDGWTVRDVAAHLSMAATASVGEVMGHFVRARGSYNRMIHDSAVARADRPTPQVVADLRGIVGMRRLAPSTFWRDPLLDILVHGQDIAMPLGRTLPSSPQAAAVAAEWAWRFRFLHVRFGRLRGVRLVAADVSWSRGEGVVLEGPVTSLLLLSTGRPAGLAGTDGPGRALLEERYAATA
jgi:uncharacterized protein (TIGR03083 family)